MENTYENEKHLSKREQIIYGISNGGQVFGYSLVTSYLMYFYINVFLIDAKIISLIFLLGGIWDIINNPLIGIFIDHKENKAGKLTSIIRKITPIQAVATSLIFLGPVFIKDNSNISATKITYLLITYFLWEFMYSITDVAFGGLVAVITPNPIERQKTISTANICMQLASSLVFVAVPLLIDVSKSDKFNISLLSVFVVIGLAAAIVGIGLFSLSGYFVKERIQQTKTVQPIKELLLSVAKNKPLVLLLLSNLISSFSGIGFAFSTYYYLDVLGYASMSILVETPAFIISLFSYSLIKVAKKRLNNKKIIILSYLCISAFRFLVFFIGLKYYSDLKVMVPLLIGSNCIVAIFGGINNVLPIELLTEATDYAEWKTGGRTEGIAFSLKNSVVKVYGTLAQGFAAVLLNVIGYVPLASSEITTQADGVQKKIWIIFSLIPAGIGTLSVLPLVQIQTLHLLRHSLKIELKSG